MYYIGLDIHKKIIAYCVKHVGGEVHSQGVVNATRAALDGWLKALPQPWTAAMEATLFTGWIYDHLLPHAASLKVAHPLMLRAIAASKKKNDRVDAAKIADLLRCDLLPECYMAPVELRERRRTLRYRNLLVRQSVQMKNKIAGLLMETGVSYNKEKLHQKRYFAQLLKESAELPDALKPLLKVGRDTVERASASERALLGALERDSVLATRVERLGTIPGVGPVTALSWALENRRGEPLSFSKTRRELLRAMQRREQFGGDSETIPDFQAAQQASANGLDRGGQVGSALEQRPGPAV